MIFCPKSRFLKGERGKPRFVRPKSRFLKRETLIFSSKVPAFEYNCRFGGGRGAKRGFVNLDGKCGNRGCPEVHNSL